MLDPHPLLETGKGKQPNAKEHTHLHYMNGLGAAEHKEFRHM